MHLGRSGGAFPHGFFCGICFLRVPYRHLVGVLGVLHLTHTLLAPRKTEGTPIMMGAGMYAYTLVGLCFDSASGEAGEEAWELHLLTELHLCW